MPIEFVQIAQEPSALQRRRHQGVTATRADHAGSWVRPAHRLANGRVSTHPHGSRHRRVAWREAFVDGPANAAPHLADQQTRYASAQCEVQQMSRSLYLINPTSDFPSYFGAEVFAARGYPPATMAADLALPT